MRAVGAGRLGDVRFAIPSNDYLLQQLVIALDQDDVSLAATWRAVGDAAQRLDLRRPSYDSVRRLANVERLRRRRRGAVRRASLDAALAFASPYVAELPMALDRLGDAIGSERLVSLRHKPPYARGGEARP